MSIHVPTINNPPSFQTTEDVRSMPSGQRSTTTWQGREVTREHRQRDPAMEGLSHGRIMTRILSFLPQPDILCRIYRGCVHVFRTCFGRSTDPCIHADTIPREQCQQDPVTNGLSSVHIMAQVLSLLPPADVARSALVCPSFRAAKALVDLEQVRTLALAFGFPKEFLFSIEGSPCRPLDESDPIIARLIQIEQTLPEALRKNNSKEELRTLAQNPTWLRGFLQTAYDNQLLIAFGKVAGIERSQSFAQQVRQVRQWFDTSPQNTFLCVEEKELLFLPKEVTRLSNLRFLHVVHSQLTELPDLSLLTQLRVLEVCGTRITKLPDLSSLTRLESLYVHNNQIVELPDLSSLANLGLLNVSENQLTRLPDLSSLTRLEHLYVGQNQLTALPDLHSLVNLQMLHVDSNQITRLPDALFLLPQIRRIVTFGNPLPVLSEEQRPLVGAFHSRGGALFR